MTLKTLEWWVILLKDFEGKYDWWMTWWILQKHWGLGSDAIPFQFYKYPHNTWIWVRLSWKLMYFSMGSLWTSVIGVMPRLPPYWWSDVKWREMRWMSGPSPVQFPGWPRVFTGRPSSWGEVPILGYVSERLWLMIRVLSYNYSGLSLTDVIKCCGTSVQPLRV